MKSIIILGAGESGIGCALLAQSRGYNVFVSESNNIHESTRIQLIENNIEFEENSHNKAIKMKPDFVVKSPGIPDTSQIIKSYIKNNINVISEIEFASRYTDSEIIAITGSNGKTTTTLLTHQILNDESLNVTIGGNIGTSFSSLLISSDYNYLVLEVSSFQLDGIVEFKPHIAVITNLSPDHLDRYKNYEDYIKSKFRIVMNQNSNDYLIYDGDDPMINSYINKSNIKSKLIPFSTERKIEEGAYYNNQSINISINKKKLVMPTENFSIKGKHNIKNAMAAATVAHLLKIRKQTIRKSLEHFQSVEHRLENVLTINKVNYINDSKATNVNAAYYALDTMEAPTIWIVGGIDKGNKYEDLFPLVHKKVKAIICLGKNNFKLIENFENIVEYIVETTSMEEAVSTAYKIAKPGYNVLLSPACASFDLFDDYKDRGRQFKASVRKL
ncbi:MAG TPA: UDP-N-acetylmuramoyl-L-alanine--D-glutamate ligase [Candidatus Marinimicrobia bacterium]|jgi:UDP-N-acetylmuramoylalanine--D-glutamate ligase|nr:UDP-N-acetylmuramoyl-L-alanine--D-glutamate ligase [Candidatus Neomarinimicrobiota bacterium]